MSDCADYNEKECGWCEEAGGTQVLGCYEPIDSKTESVAKLQCSDGLSLSSQEQAKEQIEDQLEKELGWRYAPQMRHGFKMEKLWNKLVEARYELLRKTR